MGGDSVARISQGWGRGMYVSGDGSRVKKEHGAPGEKRRQPLLP